MNKNKINSTNILAALLPARTLIILALMIVMCVVMSEHFLSATNIRNVFRQVSASCVLAIGMTGVLSSGGIDLSAGTMVSMIGVIVATLDTKTKIPFWAVILITFIVGMVCSMMNSVVANYLSIPMFMATCASSLIFKGICYVISRNSAVAGISEKLIWFGQGYVWIIPVPTVIMVVFGLIMWVILMKTTFGRHVVATGGNPLCANLSGINTRRTSIITYLLHGICMTATALILTGRSASAQPNVANDMGMDAIAAVVIGGTSMRGGRAKVFGTMLGVLIVGIIGNILNLRGVDTNWQYVAKGLFILVAVVLDSFSQKIANKQLANKA